MKSQNLKETQTNHAFGIVTKSTGSWYGVKLENNEVIQCRIKGKFKIADLPTTNPIAVGDRVLIDLATNMIVQIDIRRNYVVRQSTHIRKNLHLIAANIDQAFVITTLRQPAIKLGFIDRFLLTTTTYNIPTYIIFNKADIYEAEELEFYQDIKTIYEYIGYKTLLVSAETGEGIAELEAVLKDKTTLVSGHSGVGKSSLVNAIQPQLDLRTGEVSDYNEKGMHTTTFAEMHELDFGGQIIDTPGIKELGFVHLSEQDVAHNFLEIFKVGQRCRFGNCLHINEPQCAVKEALETGEISTIRYQSYLSIMEEVKQQNKWEQKKDW